MASPFDAHTAFLFLPGRRGLPCPGPGFGVGVLGLRLGLDGTQPFGWPTTALPGAGIGTQPLEGEDGFIELFPPGAEFYEAIRNTVHRPYCLTIGAENERSGWGRTRHGGKRGWRTGSGVFWSTNAGSSTTRFVGRDFVDRYDVRQLHYIKLTKVSQKVQNYSLHCGCSSDRRHPSARCCVGGRFQ